MKKIIDQDGKELKKAYIDGGHVVDRILDTVMFEVTIINDEIVVRTLKQYKGYMSDYNEVKFLDLLKHCIEKEINGEYILSSTIQGGDEIGVVDEDKPPKKEKPRIPITVPMRTGLDIMKEFGGGPLQANMTYVSTIPHEVIREVEKEDTLFIEKISKNIKKAYDKFAKHNYRIGYTSSLTGYHLDILMNKAELKKFLKQCESLMKEDK